MGAELLDFGNRELLVIESQIVDHSFEGSALLLVSNLQRSGRADRPAEAVGENLGFLYFSVQVNLESRALPRAVVVQDELMSASGVEGLAEALFRPDFDGVVRPLVDQSDRQVSAEPVLTLSKDPVWLNHRAMENGAVRSKSPELPKSTCVSPLNSPAVK